MPELEVDIILEDGARIKYKATRDSTIDNINEIIKYLSKINDASVDSYIECILIPMLFERSKDVKWYKKIIRRKSQIKQLIEEKKTLRLKLIRMSNKESKLNYDIQDKTEYSQELQQLIKVYEADLKHLRWNKERIIDDIMWQVEKEKEKENFIKFREYKGYK